MNNTATATRVHTSHRLSATLRLVSNLAQLGDERELIDAVVQAAAIWYDVDARAYRRGLQGRFVLDTWLPGADLTLGPRDFSAFAVVSSQEVVRISPTAELEQLGWQRLAGDLLLLPIGGGPQTPPRWIIAICDWGEPDIDPCFLVLCRMVGTAVEQLTVGRARDVQQRLLRSFVQSRGSVEQQTHAVVAELASSLPAGHARLLVGLRREAEPRILTVVGGSWPDKGDLPNLEPGQSVFTPDRIAVALAVGPAAVATIDLRAGAGQEFTLTQAMLGQAGAMVISVWLAGVLGGRSSAKAGEGLGLALASLETRIDEEVERAKRFGLELGLIVADSVQEAGRLSTLLPVQELVKHLRASDLVGCLRGGPIAVLLIHADPTSTTAAAARLRQYLEQFVQSAGLPPVALAKATFPSDADSGAGLVETARAGLTAGRREDGGPATNGRR